MNPRATLRVPLSARWITAAIATVVVVNCVMLLGTYLGKTVFRNGGAIVQLTIGELNLTGENKLAVWYSSMLLLSVALAALACWSLDRRAIRSGWDRALASAWAVIAVLFAALSLDEMGSLHERLPALLKVSLSDSLNGWVEVLALPILLVALFFVAFAWFRLRQSPTAAVLMTLGALLFVSVPAQEQFEVTTHWSSAVTETYQRPVVMALLEEGTEIFGMLAFLSAFLLYARMRVAKVSDRHDAEVASFRPSPGVMLAVIALTGAAMLLLVFGLLPRIPDRPGLGDPLNWLPSTLAFLATALAWFLWWGRPLRAGRRGASALPILAVLAVCLSADHGAGQRFTTHVLSNHFAMRLALDAALAAAVLITAAGLVQLPTTKVVRGDHGMGRSAERRAVLRWIVESPAVGSGVCRTTPPSRKGFCSGLETGQWGGRLEHPRDRLLLPRRSAGSSGTFLKELLVVLPHPRSRMNG